ncbi:MAG: thiol:disulfide interchange protein DsbC [Syntrophaceae bacterium]|nr:MAG: thiol:disulfide interchange protein DsbC [Syntrophaceae bacterium]
MNKLLIIVVMFLFLLTGCSPAQKITPEEQFKKSFSKHTYETFAETSIKGVYEVYNGRQVYYYLPEGDVILLGNIISKDGKNLTQESNTKRMTSQIAKLSLDKALKIGDGKKKVVKFTDPNCAYCRRAFEFFDKRKDDVTLYVFFLPLSQDSANKIQHILCAKDKTKAYDDILGGKLDGNAQLNLCKDKNVEELIKAHGEASAKVGVRSTPLFYIKGQVVSGFDQPAIEKLLTE